MDECMMQAYYEYREDCCKAAHGNCAECECPCDREEDEENV